MRKRIALAFGIVVLVVAALWVFVLSPIESEPRNTLPGAPYVPVLPIPPEPEVELLDLRPILQGLPEDELLYRFPNEAFLKLLTRVELDDVLGTEAEFGEAEAMLGEVFEHLERLKADPFYQASFVVQGNIACAPVLSDYVVVAAGRAPWIVFAVGNGESSRERLALLTLAKRAAAELGVLSGQVRELLGEHFDLPELSTLPSLDQRILKVLLFENSRLFWEYDRKLRQRTTPGTLAYYDRVSRASHTFGNLARPPERMYLRFAAAHQIMHAYSRILVEAQIGEEIPWGDQRLKGNLEVVETGLAWMLASGEDISTVVARLKDAREGEIELWSLEELLEIRTTGELRQRARSKGYSSFNDGGFEVLFDCQAWSFVHFLWHFEDGKYRGRFLTYLDLEFHGQGGPESFRKAFWGREEPDLETLAAQWRRHTDELLSK
jgi:hypothetical protein